MKKGETLVILDAPLLIETGMHKVMNSVIVVYVTPETQLKRLMERDKIDEELAKAKITSQMDLQKKCKLANFVVDNCGSVQQSEKRVKEIMDQLAKKKVWLTRNRLVLVLVVFLLFFLYLYL